MSKDIKYNYLIFVEIITSKEYTIKKNIRQVFLEEKEKNIKTFVMINYQQACKCKCQVDKEIYLQLVDNQKRTIHEVKAIVLNAMKEKLGKD